MCFAEAALYPTRLSRDVRWEAVDAHSAHATLTEGDISITMLFTFDEGLLGNVRAEPPERTPYSPFATAAPAKRASIVVHWLLRLEPAFLPG
jgi:hypothetical protein